MYRPGHRQWTTQRLGAVWSSLRKRMRRAVACPGKMAICHTSQGLSGPRPTKFVIAQNSQGEGVVTIASVTLQGPSKLGVTIHPTVLAVTATF
jgi:hypothetical protein